MAKKRRRFALSLRRCRASWAEKPRPSTNGSLRKSVGKCGGRRLGRRNDARKCGEVWGEPFRTAFARLRAAWFSFVSPSVKEKVWGSVGGPASHAFGAVLVGRVVAESVGECGGPPWRGVARRRARRGNFLSGRMQFRHRLGPPRHRGRPTISHPSVTVATTPWQFGTASAPFGDTTRRFLHFRCFH